MTPTLQEITEAETRESEADHEEQTDQPADNWRHVGDIAAEMVKGQGNERDTGDK